MVCVVVIRVDDVKAVATFTTKRRATAAKAAIQLDSVLRHTMALLWKA
jgi:hypothetical protein